MEVVVAVAIAVIIAEVVMIIKIIVDEAKVIHDQDHVLGHRHLNTSHLLLRRHIRNQDSAPDRIHLHDIIKRNLNIRCTNIS